MSAARIASELTVAILPLGQISSEQVELTEIVLQQNFGVKTMVMKPMEIPLSCFDAESCAYKTPWLLRWMSAHLPMEAQRIMGITTEALINKNNQRGHGAGAWHHDMAVYSTARLHERWGGGAGNELITHEFGHVLGLRHCDNTECVMHKTGPVDVLCEDCQRWADRQLQVKPGSAEERFARAETLQSIGCAAEAVESYKQAVSQAAREPHYYHRLAHALARCGKLEEAKNAEVLTTVFASDYPEFNYTHALNCLEKDPDEAEKLFALAVSAAEDKMHVHKIIGNAYREIAHNVDMAIHHYREYFQLGGDDQTIIDWYNSRLRGQEKS